MTVDSLFTQITLWLRRAVMIMILAMIAATLLRTLNVSLPIATLSPEQLAYLAGAYWLTGK